MTYLQQHARSIAEPAAFWAEQARSRPGTKRPRTSSKACPTAPIAGSPMAV